MNVVMKLMAGAALVAMVSTSVLAAEGGNARKGKYLYKKNCKTCHVDGAEGNNVTPMSKTQGQWDRYFEKDQHKDKPEVWGEYSEKDLKDIQQFLFEHAVDSDQPETCG